MKSSVITDRRRPKSVRNSLASCPRGPIDFTATGTKVWVKAMPVYLICFRVGCGAYRRGTLSDTRDGQSVHNGDVPRNAATFPPRDQSETVWSLIIIKDNIYDAVIMAQSSPSSSDKLEQRRSSAQSNHLRPATPLGCWRPHPLSSQHINLPVPVLITWRWCVQVYLSSEKRRTKMELTDLLLTYWNVIHRHLCEI